MRQHHCIYYCLETRHEYKHEISVILPMTNKTSCPNEWFYNVALDFMIHCHILCPFVTKEVFISNVITHISVFVYMKWKTDENLIIQVSPYYVDWFENEAHGCQPIKMQDFRALSPLFLFGLVQCVINSLCVQLLLLISLPITSLPQ